MRRACERERACVSACVHVRRACERERERDCVRAYESACERERACVRACVHVRRACECERERDCVRACESACEGERACIRMRVFACSVAGGKFAFSVYYGKDIRWTDTVAAFQCTKVRRPTDAQRPCTIYI